MQENKIEALNKELNFLSKENLCVCCKKNKATDYIKINSDFFKSTNPNLCKPCIEKLPIDILGYDNNLNLSKEKKWK